MTTRCARHCEVSRAARRNAPPLQTGSYSLAHLRMAATFFFACSVTSPAHAYRPFNGTDAAVADVGELETELQPAGVRREAGDSKLSPRE